MNRTDNNHCTMHEPRTCPGGGLGRRALTGIAVLSGVAALAISCQVVLILIHDKVACLNQGCAVVENLLRIPPLWFNLAGAVFFLILLQLALSARRKPVLQPPLRLLLLCGVTAEGILVSYQAFVAQTFCSYCLAICGLVIFLNLLAGLRQMLPAVALFFVPLLLFAVLQFRPGGLLDRKLTIDDGTYAIKQCSQPERLLYLIFSEDCPHCRRVLELLDGCTRCELRFNPIHTIDPDLLPGVEQEKNYAPEVNVSTLNMLGIDTIPVLIEKQRTGLKFIQGEQKITRYLRQHCLDGQEQLSTPGAAPWLDMGVGNGECRIESNCDDNLIPQ